MWWFIGIVVFLILVIVVVTKLSAIDNEYMDEIEEQYNLDSHPLDNGDSVTLTSFTYSLPPCDFEPREFFLSLHPDGRVYPALRNRMKWTIPAETTYLHVYVMAAARSLTELEGKEISGERRL